MINNQDIQEAYKRIEKYINKTPLQRAKGLYSDNKEIYFKLENQQKTGAYKLRGALSKISSLSKEEVDRGLVTISSGNHGAAVSYGAKLLGIDKVSIYVPETTPSSKLEKIASYGGKIIKLGKNYDEAHEEAMKRIKAKGETYIDPCSDVEVIGGQGTIALEILEENPSIDKIFVPIGGGGLITGISLAAKAINPKIKIIGLQTAACPAMLASLRDGIFYETYESEESICDALIGGVGEIPYKLAKETIDDILLVGEDYIKKAIRASYFQEKEVVEAAGAIGLAALLERPDYFMEGNIALVVSGGNIDKELLKQIIN